MIRGVRMRISSSRCPEGGQRAPIVCLLLLSLTIQMQQTGGFPHDNHISKLLKGVGNLSSAPSPCAAPHQCSKRGTTPETQALAVKGLVQRLLPDHASLFQIDVDPAMAGINGHDVVKVVSTLENGTAGVSVTGSGGVAAAWGVLHYLKQYCHCHISWEADQLNLPQTLPIVNVTIKAKDRVRYYQNVCTVSYSSVWWQWPRWEREIDWMALNGINLPLAFTAQEAVWRRVYLKLGLTEEELQGWFSGPAFLAWHRMGNLMAWGGPLPVSWHDATELLQKKILIRMRELGITPVLPCFAGHVPGAISRVFPEANVTRMSRWQGFNDTYSRTFFLEPSDPLFFQIGYMFVAELSVTYNYTDGFFNCDPYNEQVPSSNSSEYISSVGKAIFGAMQHAAADAVWVLQGWFLHNGFWTPENAKPLFTSVPQNRMLVLDLSAGNYPVYIRFESFYGQPFVFCMLHNYGGVDGLDGFADTLITHLTAARSSNNTMVGSGLSMEGINQNYVMYDLMMEMAWEDPVKDVGQWAADYSVRRYGVSDLQDAWRTLMKHVYNNTVMAYHGNHALFKRPSLNSKLMIWYPMAELVTVWDDMVKAASASLTYSQIQRQQETHQSSRLAKRLRNADEVASDNNRKKAILTLHCMERLKQRLAPISMSDLIKRRQVDVKGLPEAERRQVDVKGLPEAERRQVDVKGLPEAERRQVDVKGLPEAERTRDVEGKMVEGDSENEVIDQEVLECLRKIAVEEQSKADEDSEEANHIDNLDLPNAMEANTKERGTVGLDASLNAQLTFQHDLVDVTREVLQDLGAILAEQMILAYKNGSYPDVISLGDRLVILLKDLDDVLATSPDFLLGRWTQAAEAWANTQQEKELFLYNALNQITLWGPYPAGNLDYAIKQWAGVVRYYYLPRWELFISALLESLVQGTSFDGGKLNTDLLNEVELPFTLNVDRVYPTETVGDAVQMVLELYKVYRPMLENDGLADMTKLPLQMVAGGLADITNLSPTDGGGGSGWHD